MIGALPGSTIRLLPLDESPIEKDRVARVLASACEENPVLCWILKDVPVAYRKKHWQRIWNSVLANFAQRITVAFETDSTDTPSTAVGCHFSLPPFSISLGWATFLLSMGFRWGLTPLCRFLAVLEQLHRQHHAILSAPHVQLGCLAVQKMYQREGTGTRLICDFLKTADDSGVPCYLENTNEQAIAYFEQFGFRVVRKLICGTGGPLISIMIRPARRCSEQSLAVPEVKPNKLHFKLSWNRALLVIFLTIVLAYACHTLLP